MNLLDWIGAIFGIIGVVLTIFQKIWTWPISIAALIISSISFFRAELFGDASLQFIYILQSFYGWKNWNEKENLKAEIAYHLPIKNILVLVIVTSIQAIIYYNILFYFNSSLPIIDAILTASSITTTYMMIKKWIEHWILWVVIDIAYVVLYIFKDLEPYAVQYFIFAILACYGFIQWKKVIRK